MDSEKSGFKTHFQCTCALQTSEILSVKTNMTFNSNKDQDKAWKCLAWDKNAMHNSFFLSEDYIFGFLHWNTSLVEVECICGYNRALFKSTDLFQI